ncbi:variant surface glycoprotein (VSG), putative [Trypanosoma brucei brucei TREU927]|uniref:Variant surface glycoprotein (VSG), putative n=1 Tax=Trypanosoma brucei brucei (strain 927/4 GUTat10.1) TaxID=185431 RepID=Q38EL6_TRYB2|nr:variant surface glycoprotein [Trypanosoma brucei brucei TREU927]EAN76754.1 variant surface glycoprotein (VSG), putative [Trypanosoma brucei brucei TREU927]
MLIGRWAIFVSIVTLPLIPRAALVAKGAENEGDFRALCGLINLASNSEDHAALLARVEDTAANIGAISLAVEYQSFSDLERATKDWEEIADDRKHSHETNEGHRKFWTGARSKLGGPEKDKYAVWTGSALSKEDKRKVANAAERAEDCMKDNDGLWRILKETSIEKNLIEALYGSGQQNGEVMRGTYGRKDVCGRGIFAGSLAGLALSIDLLCLCGASGSAVESDQGCCAECEKGGNSDTWIPSQAGEERWGYLKHQCEKIGSNAELSRKSLSDAMNLLLKRLRPSSTRGMDLTVLGKFEGNLATGCTGIIKTGQGRCVQYSVSNVKRNNPTLPWLEKMKAAADAIDQLSAIDARLSELEDEIMALNTKHTKIRPGRGGGSPHSGSRGAEGRNKWPGSPRLEQSNGNREGISESVVGAAVKNDEGDGGDSSPLLECNDYKREQTCAGLKAEMGCEWNGDACVAATRRRAIRSRVNNLQTPLALFLLL